MDQAVTTEIAGLAPRSRQGRRLSIVVPMHDEAPVLCQFFERMEAATKDLGVALEFICVDDGSRDETLSGLVQKAARDPRVKVIALARNFGKEAALTAGIEAASGDMVVPIDADLQDPPELIAEFVSALGGGLRRRLWRQVRPLERHGDEAHHGAALLSHLQPRLRSRHPRERRRLPADGPGRWSRR